MARADGGDGAGARLPGPALSAGKQAAGEGGSLLARMANALDAAKATVVDALKTSAHGRAPLLRAHGGAGGWRKMANHRLVPPALALMLGTVLALLCFYVLDDGQGVEEDSALETNGLPAFDGLDVDVDPSGDAIEAEVPLHRVDDAPESGEDEAGEADTMTAPGSCFPRFTSGPKKLSREANPIIKFASKQGSCVFEVKLDHSEWIAATSPLRLKRELPQGWHTFAVRALDATGRVDEHIPSMRWKVDSIAPVLTVLTSPQPNDHISEPRIELEVSEAGCTYDFEAHYRPKGGNGEWQPITKRSDETPTAAAFAATEGGRGSRKEQRLAAKIAAQEASRAPYARLEPVNPLRTDVIMGHLPEGDVRVMLSVTDEAGNSDTPRIIEWALDLTPPETVIHTGPSKVMKSTDATFVVSANGEDPAEYQYEYRLDGETAWTRGPRDKPIASGFEFHITHITEGPRTIEVRTVDRAGNADETPAKYAWTVHVKAADTVVLVGPRALSNKQDEMFLITSSETQYTYAYKLDDGPVMRPAGRQLVRGEQTFWIHNITEGKHLVQVRATDVAGMEDPTPAKHEWITDLTPPTLYVIEQPSKVTTMDSARFAVNCSEKYNVLYKLDNMAWKNADGSPVKRDFDGTVKPSGSSKLISGVARFRLTNIKEGRHTIALNVSDIVGNVGSAKPITWVVDLGPPRTTIVSAPDPHSRVRKAAFKLRAGEPDCQYEYRLDRKVWRDTAGRNAKLDGMKITYKSDELSNSGAILVFDVSPGFHTLEVRARDAAGNLDPRVAAHEWVTY